MVLLHVPYSRALIGDLPVIVDDRVVIMQDSSGFITVVAVVEGTLSQTGHIKNGDDSVEIDQWLNMKLIPKVYYPCQSLPSINKVNSLVNLTLRHQTLYKHRPVPP